MGDVAHRQVCQVDPKGQTLCKDCGEGVVFQVAFIDGEDGRLAFCRCEYAQRCAAGHSVRHREQKRRAGVGNPLRGDQASFGQGCSNIHTAEKRGFVHCWVDSACGFGQACQQRVTHRTWTPTADQTAERGVITDQLNANEPVVVGVWGVSRGHRPRPVRPAQLILNHPADRGAIGGAAPLAQQREHGRA